MTDEYTVEPALTVEDYRRSFKNIWARVPMTRRGPWGGWLKEHGNRARRMEERLCERLESLEIQNEGLSRLLRAYQSGALPAAPTNHEQTAPPGETFGLLDKKGIGWNHTMPRTFQVSPDEPVVTYGPFKFERGKMYDFMIDRNGEGRIVEQNPETD